MSAAPALVPSVDVVPFRAGLAAPRSGRSSGGLAGARANPVRGEGTVERQSMTVLVVEPDPKLRRLLEVALEKAGFQVSTAATAEEGLTLVGPLRPLPSLVVAEASLPGPRGKSFCEQLREGPRTQALPILALANDEALPDTAAMDVLRKPLFVRDVVALAVLKAGKHFQERIFACDTELLPLADLLRALLAGTASGRIALASGDQLDFREGKVVRASFEGAEGELALRRILLFGSGAFSVRLGPVTPAGELGVGLREFCRSALPRVRRFERVLPRSLPLEARLSLDLHQLVRQLDQLPAEVEKLARLFDGFRTVRDALIDVDLDEPMALEALTRLYELGVLVPAPTPRAPAVIEELAANAPTSAPSSVLEGLPTEALRQLEAFQIRTVSDRPAPRPRLELLGAPVLEVLPRPTLLSSRAAVPSVKRARLAVAAVPVLAERTAPVEEVAQVASASSSGDAMDAAAATAQPLTASTGKRALLLGAVVFAALALAAVTAFVRESGTAQVAPVSTDHTTP